MKSDKSNNENVYFKARKAAAVFNDRLYSRESAAELIGVSASSLADYELGNTKVVPVDKVVLMADLYNAPQLKTQYCKNQCPIGIDYPVATEVKNIEGIALRLIKAFNPNKLHEIQDKLIEITEDGEISEDEEPDLIAILDCLDRLIEVASEMKLVGRKILDDGR